MMGRRGIVQLICSSVTQQKDFFFKQGGQDTNNTYPVPQWIFFSESVRRNGYATNNIYPCSAVAYFFQKQLEEGV